MVNGSTIRIIALKQISNAPVDTYKAGSKIATPAQHRAASRPARGAVASVPLDWLTNALMQEIAPMKVSVCLTSTYTLIYEYEIAPMKVSVCLTSTYTLIYEYEIAPMKVNASVTRNILEQPVKRWWPLH